MLLAPELTDAGLKVAVAPAGRPDADRDTDCAEPDVTAVATTAVVEPPTDTDPDEGLTEMEKSFAMVPPARFSAVSSRTKSVVPALASVSVPMNLIMTVCPA